jgi:hypothetical protein
MSDGSLTNKEIEALLDGANAYVTEHQSGSPVHFRKLNSADGPDSDWMSLTQNRIDELESVVELLSKELSKVMTEFSDFKNKVLSFSLPD